LGEIEQHPVEFGRSLEHRDVAGVLDDLRVS
jgi:hypothetical protein